MFFSPTFRSLTSPLNRFLYTPKDMSLRLLPVRSKASEGRDADHASISRDRYRPSLEIFGKITSSLASLAPCLCAPDNISLKQAAASTEPSEDKELTPPSASPPPRLFLDLPPEILEKILERTILDSDPVAWDFVGPSRLYGKESLALCPAYMSVPVLAHVNSYFRAALLAHLSRTMTFRINSRLSAEELGQGPPWFRLLDSRGECGIRRLQVRLSKADSKGKKANLNLRYFAPSREWKIELVVDQGFEEEDDPAAGARPFPAIIQPCKPNYLELDMLRIVLQMVRYPS